MRLLSLKIRNYRTLESLDLELPSVYAAICGANDSGKTNVVRAIRSLVKGDSPGPFAYRSESGVSLKDDYPKWKQTEPTKREVSFQATIELNKHRDIGFYEFVLKQLSLPQTDSTLRVSLTVTYRGDKDDPTITTSIGGKDYSDLHAQEVLKKLQSSKSILFHNSTENDRRFGYPGGSIAGHIREITGQHEALVTSMKKTVNRGLSRISKAQQAEFEGLLGRLQTKYKVGLSMPAFDFGFLPFSITLGDKKFAVPLDDWGSGTRNRTLVLLALFRARQIGDAEPSAEKITPVIVVEEPESFLHPLAQAEFGRVLRDLANEFQVQVIVTTHSPYLLNPDDTQSNILLERRLAYRQLRETERVGTSGDNWMAPFAQALGLGNEEFKPWKNMLLTTSDAILLVEGETDKEYFEMLRDPGHGGNKLDAQCEIVPYEGTGALSNTVLLRFIRNRYRNVFVTFDLDAADRIERTLQSLQLEKHKHYLPIGVNAAGKKNIEGLLPSPITTAVYGANTALVQAATAGNREEQKDAKGKLKKLLLAEFKKRARPGSEYFGGFYPLARAVNKAFS